MNIDMNNVSPQLIALQLLSQADARLCEAAKEYHEIHAKARALGMTGHALTGMGAKTRSVDPEHVPFAPFGDDLVLDEETIKRFDHAVEQQIQAKAAAQQDSK